MKLTYKNLFATTLGEGNLGKARGLNGRLLSEIGEFSRQDKMGREWSKENYRGGYTSYASLSDLHHRSPVFLEFAEKLQPLVDRFAKQQKWDTSGLVLRMNSCWMNIMPRHTYHPLHLHPHSVVSGVYYVSVPRGSVSLKLEDPRMGLYMNSPLKKSGGLYELVTPREGSFVLFESWLRHEVPPNLSTKPRISLSFNYSLEDEES